MFGMYTSAVIGIIWTLTVILQGMYSTPYGTIETSIIINTHSFTLIIYRVPTSTSAYAKEKHGTISRSLFWRTVHSLRKPIPLRVSDILPVTTYVAWRSEEEGNSRTPVWSKQGNKKDNITIIYTPWSNLQKDGSMATGQVSFHNPKLVRKVLVRTRENPIVNRLNKTRVEKFPDLRAEKEESLKKKRHSERKSREQQKEREKQERREREQLKWQKDHAYDDMFSEENMMNSSNQDRGEDFLDDFMWHDIAIHETWRPLCLVECNTQLTLSLSWI